MDVNNTAFHLLLGEADWTERVEARARVGYDPGRESVTLLPLLFRFRTSPSEVPPSLTTRLGAGRDRFGHWYWIDPGGTEIRVLRHGKGQATHWWSSTDAVKPEATGGFAPVASDPVEPLRLRGLAVTEHHYLVAGVLSPNPGLLIFDLHAGGPPQHLLWPAAVPFAPFDIAPAYGGGVVVLDGSDPSRYWLLDRSFRVVSAGQQQVPLEPPVPETFQPVEGEPEPRERLTFPGGIAPQLAASLAMTRPIAIAALPDGSVLVLDEGVEGSYSLVARYRHGKLIGEPLKVLIPADKLEDDAADLPLRGFDLAFLPAALPSGSTVAGTLLVAGADGNQTYAFALRGDAATTSCQLELRYLPMRHFSGKGLVAAGEQAYYDYRDSWMPVSEQPRPRYEDEGFLVTTAFDGKEPGCVWHRIFLDAAIPGGTQVRLESRAADELERLADSAWEAEPAPYRRTGGAELAYYRPFGTAEADLEGTGTWELLLQRARGRYIQLRLTLTGTGRATPRIRALRLYYPRFSYLREYLPDIYQEDPRSASFMERFLANPEGLYTALEERIAQAQVLFDVRTAPSEYLDWLAGWFGAMLDPSWDDGRRRLFLTHAPELFRQRGTVAGLIRAIRLATDPCPDDSLFTEEAVANAVHSVRIVERFLTRRAPAVVFGDPTLSAPVTVDDVGYYREFLLRKYRRIEALNAAYGTTYRTFEAIDVPTGSAQKGVVLEDWNQFVTIYLPAVANAHRFTVLVPTRGAGSSGPSPQVVRRIVELEKPAHTQFEVKEYWAMFRVGEARLGQDTYLELGSRLAAIRLGEGVLSQGYLSANYPWNVTERAVVGRDRILSGKGEGA